MFGKASNASVRPTALGLMVQASCYGQTIPRIYGRTQGPMYVIWANNLRESDSGKKGKLKNKVPTYGENADFLLASNPVVGTLRMWDNSTTRQINIIQVIKPLVIAGQLTLPIVDPGFRNILGVAVTIPYDVTFNDYGGDGSRHLTGTFDCPLWNAAFAGPDPANPAAYQYAPFVYYWYPGSPGSIRLFNYQNLQALGATQIIITYSQVVDLSKGGPLAQLRMEFEYELGSGSEYVGYEAERIRYPSYAGIGTSNLDLGAAQAMPNLKAEVIGTYPLYLSGDADYTDMIEDIIRQGQAQASPAVTATAAYTPLQFGLSCWESPAAIQKMFVQGLQTSQAPGPVTYDRPVTAGNILLIAINCGEISFQGTDIPVITDDSMGNTWTPLFAGVVGGYQAWYTTAIATGQLTVTFGFIGGAWDIQMFEVNGVDTVNATAIALGPADPAAADITTTNLPGDPCFIFAWAGNNPGRQPHPVPSAYWKNLITGYGDGGNVYGDGPVWSYSQYRIVHDPGTYRFAIDVGLLPADSGNVWRIALVALTRSQPSATPKPFGNILDADALQLVRNQCRAYGLYGSLCMDSQKKGGDWLDDLGVAGNIAYVWSGFKLKCLPRAEASAVGNGAIYTAPTAAGPLADLTTSDFVGDESQPMVTVTRKTPVERFSVLQLQHPSRQQARPYAPIVTSQPDQAALAIYGIRKADPKVLSCVQTITVARKVLGIMVRRQQSQPNTYGFTLNARHLLLEAWDLVTITDDKVPGIDHLPVRLTKAAEDAEHNLVCEAEDFVYGVHNAVESAVTENQGFNPNPQADPGDVNPPIIFKSPAGMNPGKTGTILTFGLSGASEDWGGCAIFASADGTSYTQIGQQKGKTPMGVLTADFPVTGNPDATDDIQVDLTESAGELPNFSNIDEDNFVPIAYLEGGNAGSQPVVGPIPGVTLTPGSQADVILIPGEFPGNPDPKPTWVLTILRSGDDTTTACLVDSVTNLLIKTATVQTPWNGCAVASSTMLYILGPVGLNQWAIKKYSLPGLTFAGQIGPDFTTGAPQPTPIPFGEPSMMVLLNGGTMIAMSGAFGGLTYISTGSWTKQIQVCPGIPLSACTLDVSYNYWPALQNYNGSLPRSWLAADGYGFVWGMASGHLTKYSFPGGGESVACPCPRTGVTIPTITTVVDYDLSGTIGSIDAFVYIPDVDPAKDSFLITSAQTIYRVNRATGTIVGAFAADATQSSNQLPDRLGAVLLQTGAGLTAFERVVADSVTGATGTVTATYQIGPWGFDAYHTSGNAYDPSDGSLWYSWRGGLYHIYLDGKPSCIPFEIIAYGVADLTAPNQYDISAQGGAYIRRAVFGTPLTPHFTGKPFGFFGPNAPQTRITVDPVWIGKQIFFKFPSFNRALGGQQTLAQVTAYPYTIPDSCASAILGAPPAREIPLIPSGPGNFQVPHALGSVPTLVLIQMTSSGNIWLQPGLRYDGTNIYLTASDAGVTGRAFVWNVPAGTEIALNPIGDGNFQVPNTLGVVPILLGLQMTSGGNIWSQPIEADINFLYFTASGSPVSGYMFAWSVGSPVTGPINTQFIEIPLAPTAAGNFTIPHGLGVTPLAAFIRMSSGGRIWFQSIRYDNANLYLTASDAGITGFVEVIVGQFAPGGGTGGMFVNNN